MHKYTRQPTRKKDPRTQQETPLGAMVLLAGNLVLLGGVSWLFDADVWFQTTFWLTLLLSTLLCLSDLSRGLQTVDSLPTGISDRVFCVATGMVVFAIFSCGILCAAALRTPLTIFGVVLCLFGGWLRTLAVRCLGHAFVSDVQPVDGASANSPHLSTGGVYRRIRHPSEVGLLMCCFGLSMATNSTVSFVLTVCVLLPLSIYRVNAEEKWLRKAFGQSFEQYAHETGKWLPRKWLSGVCMKRLWTGRMTRRHE